MGWNEEMKKLKRAASKDYYLGKTTGKPRQGDMHMYDTMLKSRKLFKSKVQNLKRQEKVNFGEALYKQLQKDNQSCSWQNVQKGIKPVRCGTAVRVGEVVKDNDILSVWRDYFSSIVNSESSQKRKEEQLMFEMVLRERMSGLQLPWWCIEIIVSEVLKAFCHLKLNKAAGCNGTQPEHIKYGGFTLSMYLSVAFTMFLRHSFVPRQFLTSYIVPIVKDRRGDRQTSL